MTYRLNRLEHNMNRETWLNNLANLMAPRFEELGHPLPKFRVAIGFPSSGKDGRASAECWHKSRSADESFQIFIRPDQDDTMMIAGDLAHELTHAAVGFEAGHKGDFAKVVLALGLNRPLTATTPGPKFIEYATPLVDQLGPIPHARLTWPGSRGWSGAGQPPKSDAQHDAEDAGDAGVPERGSSNAKPKQSTRLLKASCKHSKLVGVNGEQEVCGYTIRLSRKWAKELGACCPAHGPMEVEGADDSGGDDDADQ
jgi:hypothetical protein